MGLRVPPKGVIEPHHKTKVSECRDLCHDEGNRTKEERGERNTLGPLSRKGIAIAAQGGAMRRGRMSHTVPTKVITEWGGFLAGWGFRGERNTRSTARKVRETLGIDGRTHTGRGERPRKHPILALAEEILRKRKHSLSKMENKTTQSNNDTHGVTLTACVENKGGEKSGRMCGDRRACWCR